MSKQKAFLLSYARTPMGRSYKGSLKEVTAPSLFGHAISHALNRSGLDAKQVDEVIMGCALPEGSQYYNIGRLSALAAGLPNSVAGMTVDRQCASGLMSIAIAAQQIETGQNQIVIAGGGEHISLVQNQHMNQYANRDQPLLQQVPAIYMPMLQTAEMVATRYQITRERQDEFAVMSQQRAASEQSIQIRNQEIAPIPEAFLKHFNVDASGDFAADETLRPTTTLAGLAQLASVLEEPDKTVTAGNACCFADAAAAVTVVSEDVLKQQAMEPLAIFHGVAVAGCNPDEMGVGPIYAVPKLLKRFGLKVADIDLWELNEAFASQAIYCIQKLGLDVEKVNVNGGAIALGHPYGMTGARLVGSAMITAKQRGNRYAVITMCVGGGQGAAGLIEIL